MEHRSDKPEDLLVAILAGGQSSRFGGVKMLAPIAGEPMLQRVIGLTAGITGANRLVVLGAHAEEIRDGVDFRGAQVCINLHWQEGIASSIRAAVTAVPPGVQGILLMAGDQPVISAAELEALVASWRADRSRVVAARYAGVLGIPALFPVAHSKALLGLVGDSGARKLLAANRAVAPFDMPRAQVDVDTRQDLDQLPLARR